VTERILLIGGSGMVGRNVREHPGFVGHEIVAPTREEVDLLDRFAVADVIRAVRPGLIVHAAGRVGGIAANQGDQAGFLSENLTMGVNLLTEAVEQGVPRFLNISSSCIYPRDAPNPLREEALFSGPPEPTNEGYALAKLTVLRLGELLSRQHGGFRCVSLIPCNLYGRWDHFEPERSHLVPAVVRKLHDAKVAGHSEVDIWGDGSARREFMLASDLAGFVAAAVVRFEDLPERVNVGVGRDHSVNEYYEAAARVVGYEGGFTHDLSRPVGMRRKLVDIRVQDSLGWIPPTDLESGLEATYRFFLEHAS